MFRPLAILLAASTLVSCGSLERLTSGQSAVVYALGARDGFPSPLSKTLTPVCPALTFPGDSHTTSGRHHISLSRVAGEAKKDQLRLLVAGYTSPGLPQDYARSLSERRAQAVRQRLIEMGVEPATVHTLGLGNDFSPTGPSSDVVVIYRASPAGLPSPAASE